jgi:eukaryotic-like serine/threonine-protein kinase
MDPRIHARFLREAQITGRLEHPGIVPVYDLGTTAKGSPFYVMRLVRGDTLSKALAACTADRAEAELAKRLQLLGTFIDICEAMAYAHSRGVVHRDLKPGNVVLGAFGETILLDWGLAKLAAEADAAAAGTVRITDETPADLTRQGAIMGTPAYMAPEQLDPRFGTSIRAPMSSHSAVSFTSSWSVMRRSLATSTASWQPSARPRPCPPPARRRCQCLLSSSPSAIRP